MYLGEDHTIFGFAL